MNINQKLVNELYTYLEGKWHRPSYAAAWAFLVTEVAEVGDILLRQGHFGEFVRNHDEPSGREQLVKELGDVQLMLCALANSLDVDLDYALDVTYTQLRLKHGDE